MTDIEDVIYPLDLNEFQVKYWENRAIVIEGARDKFNQLFSLDSFWKLLKSNQFPHSSVYIAQNGEKSIPKSYQELVRAVCNNASILVEDVDLLDEKLSTFLNTVSKNFIRNTRFNLYYSQPNIPAYYNHYDTHDVFILQIKGSKHWRVFSETIDKPVFKQKTHGIKPPNSSTEYINKTINEGDVLYIPRGHWHYALAVNEPSLHLTLAVFPLTGIYFMNWLADELTENISFRQNFVNSIDVSNQFDRISEFDKHINMLKRELLKHIDNNALGEQFFHNLISRIKYRNGNSFTSVLKSTNEEALIKSTFYKTTKIYTIVNDGSKLRILVNNKSLVFPVSVENLTTFIFSVENFTLDDILKNYNYKQDDVIKVLRLLIEEELLFIED